MVIVGFFECLFNGLLFCLIIPFAIFIPKKSFKVAMNLSDNIKEIFDVVYDQTIFD